MRALTLLLPAALACACAAAKLETPRTRSAPDAPELGFDHADVVPTDAPTGAVRRFGTRDGLHALVVVVGSDGDPYAAIEAFGAEVGSCAEAHSARLHDREAVRIRCESANEVREALALTDGPLLVVASCRAARAVVPERCGELLETLHLSPPSHARYPVRLARPVAPGTHFAIEIVLRRQARAYAQQGDEPTLERARSAALEARLAGEVLEVDRAGIPLRVRYVIESADATLGGQPVAIEPGTTLAVDFRHGGPRAALDTEPSSEAARELSLALGEAAYWPMTDAPATRDVARAIDETWPLSRRIEGKGRHRLVAPPLPCDTGECLEIETSAALRTGTDPPQGQSATQIYVRARYPLEPGAAVRWQSYERREQAARSLENAASARVVGAVVTTAAESHIEWHP